MDAVVPPLVQKEAEPHPQPVYWICGSDPTTGGFFSDDEDELENEKSPSVGICEEESLSLEEEFGDEILDISASSEGEFDSLGDLELLERLLYQEPSVGIEEHPCEESREDISDSIPPIFPHEFQEPRHDPYSISIREVSRFEKFER
jgi:hypothetical protein